MLNIKSKIYHIACLHLYRRILNPYNPQNMMEIFIIIKISRQLLGHQKIA